MTTPGPNDSPMFVRLSAEQKERVRIVSRAYGASMSDYAIDAIMRQVALDERKYAPLIALQSAARETE